MRMKFVATVLGSWFTCVSAVAPLVDLGYSKYLGTDNGNGISQWLGLRYAAPPIENLRFSKPAEPAFNPSIQAANKVW